MPSLKIRQFAISSRCLFVVIIILVTKDVYFNYKYFYTDEFLSVKSGFRNKFRREAISDSQQVPNFINESFNIYPRLSHKHKRRTNGQKDREPLKILKPNNKQYLLPLLHFQEGPNNLFRLFKQTALIALQNNQAITFPIFHSHPRMKDSADDPFKLPIFQKDYFVDLLHNPEDTFYVDKIAEKMGVLDSDVYFEECGGRIESLIKCGKLDSKQSAGIDHYLRASKLRIGDHEEENENQNKLIKDAIIEIDTIEGYSIMLPDPRRVKCLALVFGKSCLPDDKTWIQDYQNLLSDSIQRPKILTAAVDLYIQKVIKTKKYLALHWRYDDDWLDMCVKNRGPYSRTQNVAICKLVFDVNYNLYEEQKFIEKLKFVLEQHNLEAIYLATTPNNQNFLELIQENFGNKIHTFSNVDKFFNETLYPGFLTNNNYYGSFIEQEICYKSQYFLGSSLSSWTQTVIADRLAIGNYNQGSILLELGSSEPIPPGYPPLIFQFPEGWFNFQFPKDSDTGLMYSQKYAIGGENESLESLRASKGLRCLEAVNDLTFIKIHGVENDILDKILMRYVVKYKLNVGIGDVRSKYSDFNVAFEKDFIVPSADENQENQKIQILSEHLNFSPSYKKFINRSMRYITMIKNPIEMLKKFWLENYNLSDLPNFQKNLPFSEFDMDMLSNNVANTSDLSETITKFYENFENIFNSNVPYSFKLKNPILNDLNNHILVHDEDHNSHDHESVLINSEMNFPNFHFVLIADDDLLEESLFLLHRKLCWKIEDLIHFKSELKVESRSTRNSIILPEKITSKLENSILDKDFKIYKFYKNILLNEIKKIGPTFTSEFEKFKNKIKAIDDTCHSGKKNTRCDILKENNRNKIAVGAFPDMRGRTSRFLVGGERMSKIEDEKIYNKWNIYKFLNQGRMSEDGDFIPGDCQKPLEITALDTSEIKATFKNTKIAIIGHFKTINTFTHIFSNLGIQILKISSKNFKIKLDSLKNVEFVILGDAWLDRVLAESNNDDENFDKAFENLKILIKFLEKSEKLKKMIAIAAEPFLLNENDEQWSQKFTKIEKSRQIFNNNFKNTINQFDNKNQNIYYMSNNLKTFKNMRNEANDRDDINKILYKFYDDYYKIDRKVKFTEIDQLDESTGIRDDIYMIFKIFLMNSNVDNKILC